MCSFLDFSKEYYTGALAGCYFKIYNFENWMFIEEKDVLLGPLGVLLLPLRLVVGQLTAWFQGYTVSCVLSITSNNKNMKYLSNKIKKFALRKI